MATQRKTKKKVEEEVVDEVLDEKNILQQEEDEKKKEAEELKRQETAKLVKIVLNEDDRKRRFFFFGKRKKEERDLRAEIMNAERYQAAYNIGLTMDQVQSREEQGLTNNTTNTFTKTYRAIFFGNMFTFFNLLCIAVAVALTIVNAFLDLAFLVIMFINMFISIFQEIRAKWALDKLSLISAVGAVVVRNNERITIPINSVVLDDILYLENGRQICSDCVIIRGEVEVNESLLTGESVPVVKTVGDFLYGGSFISSGSCYSRVDKIGSTNYAEGLTSFAKRYQRPKSELLHSMRLIIRFIGFIIIPLSVFLFYTNSVNFDNDLSLTITKTAGAIIGMIPSGMFLLTTMALAISQGQLARVNVLVKDFFCIEMLARVDTLCLDKTGTITDGTMKVHDVIEFDPVDGHPLSDIVGSYLQATEDNNQTAIALANYFGYANAFKRSVILPFSSERKYSAVQFDKVGSFMLGAPEYIIPNMDAKLSKIVSDKMKEGYRVLMLAYSPNELRTDQLPTSRRPLAIFVLEDHIRPDAPDTIKWFMENDVDIKIISGDNPVTVSEVAKRVGIKNAEMYISLDGISDPEVVELANQYTVFGRVTPEQKRLLIRSIKAKGHKVAMTGDGVNDILALKEADCAIAMANGSEATRNVAHLTLLDSNFSRMPNVVFEGRRVVNNIQRSASLFLMKTIFSVMLSIITISTQTGYPIAPSQFLILEMFIIGAPSILLTIQKNSNRIEGRFIANVLKNSLPAAITMLVAYYVVVLFNVNFPLEGIVVDNGRTFTELTRISIVAITFAGWVSLLKLCLPLDNYRMTICLLSGILSFTAFELFPSIFQFGPLSLVGALLLICICALSFYFLYIVSLLLAKIKIN